MEPAHSGRTAELEQLRHHCLQLSEGNLKLQRELLRAQQELQDACQTLQERVDGGDAALARVKADLDAALVRVRELEERER